MYRNRVGEGENISRYIIMPFKEKGFMVSGSSIHSGILYCKLLNSIREVHKKVSQGLFTMSFSIITEENRCSRELVQKGKKPIYSGRHQQSTKEIGVFNGIPKEYSFRKIEEKAGIGKKAFLNGLHLRQSGFFIKGRDICCAFQSCGYGIKRFVKMPCFNSIRYGIIKAAGKALKASGCNKVEGGKLAIQKGEGHMAGEKPAQPALHKGVIAEKAIQCTAAPYAGNGGDIPAAKLSAAVICDTQKYLS